MNNNNNRWDGTINIMGQRKRQYSGCLVKKFGKKFILFFKSEKLSAPEIPNLSQCAMKLVGKFKSFTLNL